MITILRAKCVVAGDSAVGKSALNQAFHTDGLNFPKNYIMTTGVSLLVKPVNIPDTNVTVELYLFDSTGKDILSDNIHLYWDQCSVICLVYDVTNETSFQFCNKVIEKIKSSTIFTALPGVLVANKTDLQERRVVSPKAGKDFAESNGLEYFECSAKDGNNIDAPFYYLANEWYKLYLDKVEHMKSLS